MKTCSQCRYSTPFIQDMTKVVCEGLPPKPVLVPAEQKQMDRSGKMVSVPGMALQFMNPVLDAKHKECWLWRARETVADALDEKFGEPEKETVRQGLS